MGVQHGVRRTLIALAGGAVAQRLCQLAAFVLIGRALGVGGLGVYAQGMALGAALAALAAAGRGQATARAVAARPAAAGAIVRTAVRRRLVVGIALATGCGLIASATASEPWFWWLCALQTLPSAWDQKLALDASGRTRVDARVEAAAALLQLGATAALVLADHAAPVAFAAAALAARCLHAAGAAQAIRDLPGQRADGVASVRSHGALACGQIAHEVLALGDVWLVALALGDAAAGLYGLASRFAVAALMPSVQVARLLLPHLLHAAVQGERLRTLGAALRATALATVPVAAGGAVAADALCGLAGPAFGGAAPALRLLLLAGVVQHLGWQCSHALLAAGRDRVYALGMIGPAAAHAAALAAAPAWFGGNAGDAAAAAAAIAIAAHGAYAACGFAATKAGNAVRGLDVAQPLAVAALTAGAAAVPAALADGGLPGLAMQLAAGGCACALGLWLVEFRGRIGRVGDGLAAASGFRS